MGVKKGGSAIEQAKALGARDAQSALDSGDYGYHKTTKGLSTLELIDDMWSFRVEAMEKLAADKKELKRCAAEYRRAWRAKIKEEEHPAPKPLDALLAKLQKDGELDFRDLPDAKEVPAALEGLKTVTRVSVNRRKLAHFERLFTMPNVRSAGLLALGWKEVPPEIRAWKKLEGLWLTDNPLVSADPVCELTSLEELDLGGARLPALPERIGSLSQLEELDLFQAKATFSALPASFGQLKSLKKLRLPLDAAKLKALARKLLPRAKIS